MSDAQFNFDFEVHADAVQKPTGAWCTVHAAFLPVKLTVTPVSSVDLLHEESKYMLKHACTWPNEPPGCMLISMMHTFRKAQQCLPGLPTASKQQLPGILLKLHSTTPNCPEQATQTRCRWPSYLGLGPAASFLEGATLMRTV